MNLSSTITGFLVIGNLIINVKISNIVIIDSCGPQLKLVEDLHGPFRLLVTLADQPKNS